LTVNYAGFFQLVLRSTAQSIRYVTHPSRVSSMPAV